MIVLVFLASCNNETCRESVQWAPVELEVERLEELLFRSTSYTDIEDLLRKDPDFATLFLDADQYPSDSILAKKMFSLISNPAIDTLYQESLKAFDNLDQVISELEQGLGRLKAYYPETRTPKVQTVVSGLYKDLFISNEHIMIGMDFFVGEMATFKPLDIPNYILRRYNTEHLPSIVLQYISSQYVVPGKGEALLTEMIDIGKSYYLLGKILPCTQDRILIGYTEQEWADAEDNDEIIWANFIQNKLLYETNHTMKQKFLGERPNVYEIGDKCPGRIAAWVGWQIVNAYMEKSNVSVQQLMSETDHNKIFTQSGYKPS